MQTTRPEVTSQFAVRAMTIQDVPAGLRLCRASGWNQLEEDWRCFLELEGGSCWLAERNSTPCGTVAVLRYDTGFAWLAMMLVDPAQRGQGVGSFLMDAALAALEKLYVRLDATPAGAPLYGRYGFRTETELARMKGNVDVRRLPGSGGRVRPIAPGDLSAVLARDRKVFGADRGALLHAFYRVAPQFAWMKERGGELQGYCFGRPGYLYNSLGPVVADSVSSAGDVVSACLAPQSGRSFALDMPRGLTEWIAWLEWCGFTMERPFFRMCRQESIPWGSPECQFGIAGPEFG